MTAVATRCAGCEAELLGVHGNRKFCSDRCREREKFRRLRGSAAWGQPKLCSKCGTTFSEDRRRAAPSKRCPDCRASKPWQPETRACTLCGVEYLAQRPTRRFCSSECRARARYPEQNRRAAEARKREPAAVYVIRLRDGARGVALNDFGLWCPCDGPLRASSLPWECLLCAEQMVPVMVVPS